MRKLIEYKLILANGNILDNEFGEIFAKFIIKIHTSMENGWELYDDDCCCTNNKNIMWQAMVKYEDKKCAN